MISVAYILPKWLDLLICCSQGIICFHHRVRIPNFTFLLRTSKLPVNFLSGSISNSITRRKFYILWKRAYSLKKFLNWIFFWGNGISRRVASAPLRVLLKFPIFFTTKGNYIPILTFIFDRCWIFFGFNFFFHLDVWVKGMKIYQHTMPKDKLTAVAIFSFI